MRSIVEDVARYWAEAGFEPRPGISAAALREFERRHGVVLPSDFVALYRATDGIVGDANLFALWPLAEVRPIPHECPSLAGTVPSAAEFFVFADSMIHSHVFAVRLTPGAPEAGPVLWLCDPHVGEAAETFTAFWERYLRDPREAVMV